MAASAGDFQRPAGLLDLGGTSFNTAQNIPSSRTAFVNDGKSTGFTT
jgi:hypothetical protein